MTSFFSNAVHMASHCVFTYRMIHRGVCSSFHATSKAFWPIYQSKHSPAAANTKLGSLLLHVLGWNLQKEMMTLGIFILPGSFLPCVQPCSPKLLGDIRRVRQDWWWLATEDSLVRRNLFWNVIWTDSPEKNLQNLFSFSNYGTKQWSGFLKTPRFPARTHFSIIKLSKIMCF